MTSDRFDIEAKAAEDATPDQMSRKLQVLLADRFGLIVHRETRQLPIYHLLVAKGGSKLETAKQNVCTPMVPPPAQIDPATLRPCGGFNSESGMMLGGSVSTARLAVSLSRLLGRTVVDETGLVGSYDISLRWTPDDAAQGGEISTFPSLFTAIEERL